MSAIEERKALDRLSQAYRRMTTPRARVPPVAELPPGQARALEAPQPGQGEREQEPRPSG